MRSADLLAKHVN